MPRVQWDNRWITGEIFTPSSGYYKIITSKALRQNLNRISTACCPPDAIRNTIQLIQKRYQEFFPGNPFDYFFLDEYFNQQYQADELFGKVFLMFSLLALFITSLGIFGLASFTVTQRTKEIGIRKALGASINQILVLFIRDILQLILLAFLIVIPVLLFGLREWLSSFARRIPLQADLFILPLLILITITLSTIGYQIIKASLTNPVEVLRYE